MDNENEFDITKFPHIPLTSPSNINRMKIPKTRMKLNAESVNLFNQIIEWKNKYSKNWHPIKRTPSNGISKAGLQYPAFDIDVNVSCIELVILCSAGMWDFILGLQDNSKNKDNIYGKQCWALFTKMCKDKGIDYKADKLDEARGYMEKEKIPKPLIMMMDDKFIGQTIENAHHIDINSSFCFHIAEKYPKYLPVFEEIYQHRKEKPEYKKVLCCIYGYAQSKFVHYGWSNLSRAALEGNNRQICDLLKRLKKAGCVPIATNTDGIWYSGPIFHDSDEGTSLGQFKNDHVNCTLRFKSAGAYEYLEDGKYFPVVRGATKRDRMIDRSLWAWGDIFRDDTKIEKYKFNEETERVEIVYEEN